MPEVWIIILFHQLLFQAMFVTKNIILYMRIGKQIRGDNKEATISIIFFTLFIGVSVGISILNNSFGKAHLLNDFLAMVIGLVILILNLFISLASLISMKDSWRIGVLENQKTELVTSGIYRFTRNAYFVSYLLMFVAYTVLLQNVILLGLSVLGFVFIHKMIIKEEIYLHSVHGVTYTQYKTKVPRYLIL